MNDLITLELKQNQSGNVNSNGDYNTILTKPIDILEGDEISISKCFIDTADEEQTSIEVPEDLNFTFSGHIYNTNWNDLGKAYSGVTGSDSKKYVLCTETSSQIAVSGELIESISFKINFEPESGARSWGGAPTTWSYKDLEGQFVLYHLFVPSLQTDPYDPSTTHQTLNVGVVCEPNTFKLYSPSTAVLLALPYLTEIASIASKEVEGGTKIFTPTLFSKTFLIEKGSYTPTYFAKYVTDNLIRNEYSAINPANIFSPSKNTFLFPSNDLSGTQIFVDSETGSNAFKYPYVNPNSGGGSYWVGSSQLSLQFADNRFYWSNLHMPIYDAKGNAGIHYIGNTGDALSVVPATNNSGVFWNSITTDSTNPKFLNFFQNILGFDFTKTTPSYTTAVSTIGTDLGYVHIYKWNDENWTGALNSVDVGVIKNGTFYNIQNATSLVTLTSETQSIYANDIFSSADFVFGYFTIAIESVFKNLLVGRDIKNNISAIVSRYYESNSYATGTALDAIRYVHKGSPVQLSSIGIRILDSNGKLATSIGADNSVYLQVIKAQQPTPAKK